MNMNMIRAQSRQVEVSLRTDTRLCTSFSSRVLNRWNSVSLSNSDRRQVMVDDDCFRSSHTQ